MFISVRIDRKVTTGNAEEDFTEEEISAIQMKLVNKTYITDCINTKHERRIVSGKLFWKNHMKLTFLW